MTIIGWHACRLFPSGNLTWSPRKSPAKPHLPVNLNSNLQYKLHDKGTLLRKKETNLPTLPAFKEKEIPEGDGQVYPLNAHPPPFPLHPCFFRRSHTQATVPSLGFRHR
jgi:hypothetical protein